MPILDDIVLTAFGPEHLDGAVALSRQAAWPHRPDDWDMVLRLSAGTVAVDGAGRVRGTALMTPYGRDCATINMVLVDAALRRRGLARRLMAAAQLLAGDRPLRLIATADGLPLYRQIGFVECGEIRQHQGIVTAMAATELVGPATAADLPAIAALDRAAFGADRRSLFALLESRARWAILRREGAIDGFAAIRAFGRGEVIGPVVASDVDDAKALVAFLAAPRAGAFLRVDTPSDRGLTAWLAGIGLGEAGGGIVMRMPAPAVADRPRAAVFALASQALG